MRGHFTTKDNCDRFHELCIRISRVNNVPLAESLQEDLVNWLKEVEPDKPETAEWLLRTWLGKNRRWTQGHCGAGDGPTNNPTEGFNGKYKSALGDVRQPLSICFSNTTTFLQEHSLSHSLRFAEEGHPIRLGSEPMIDQDLLLKL